VSDASDFDVINRRLTWAWAMNVLAFVLDPEAQSDISRILGVHTSPVTRLDHTLPLYQQPQCQLQQASLTTSTRTQMRLSSV
jgi:hypothetical protein